MAIMYACYIILYIATPLKDEEEPLDVSDIPYKSPKHNWWVKDLKLEMSDLVSITAGRELSDKVINAAMLLLSKQYGHVDGMQDCTLGHYLHFTPINQTLAIQIFHTGEKFLQDITRYSYILYTHKFLRDVNFAVFAVNLSSTKFKSSKFYKTVVIHLKYKV